MSLTAPASERDEPSTRYLFHLARVAAILVLSAPLAGDPQEVGKVPRIGILHTIPPADTFQAFRQGLLDLGYVEGQHVSLEYRWPGDGEESLGAFAAQVVQSKFDVILAVSAGVAHAASQATGTVPLVFCAVGEDPVRRGWISSLARPGGSATGTVTLAVDLEAKRLELLKEAVPGLARAAALYRSGPVHRRALLDVEAAARQLGIRVVPVEWKATGTSTTRSILPAVSESAVCWP